MNTICRRCHGVMSVQAPKAGNQKGFCGEECRKAHRREYLQKWCAENGERVALKRDANRLQVRAWGREFYARNRERRKKLRREIYKAAPEKAYAAHKVYCEQNPDKIRELGRKSALTRRARILEVFVEVIDPIVVFTRDAGICGICKKPVDVKSKWHVDHVMPLAKGGSHAYANVQLAHGRCNRSKGARHYTLF